MHVRGPLSDTPRIDLPTLLNFITTGAVVIGVFFGLFELRQALANRRDVAALQIIGTYQTQEIRRAIAKVMTLPDDSDPELINRDPEMLAAALATDSTVEAWGTLVYEGAIDLHMMDRIGGGVVRGSWRRLHAWVESERLATRTPNVGEWWQWLYERMEADPDPGKAAGAYVSYRDKLHR